jgi:hypothetical protein
VLTLGLGAVLVAVLRTPGSSSTAVLHGKDDSATTGTGNGTGPGTGTGALAGTVPPATPPADELAKARPAPEPATPSRGSTAVAPPALGGQTDGSAKPSNPLYAAAQKSVAARSLDDAAATRAVVADSDAMKARLLAAGVHVPANGKTVCFVVSADAPAAAVDQVRGFFDRHSIAFDSLPDDRLALQSTRGGIMFGNSRRAAEGGRGMQTMDQEKAASRSRSEGGGGVALNQNANQNQQQLVPNGNEQAGNNSTASNSNKPGADAAHLATAGDKDAAQTPASQPTSATDVYYVAHGVTPLQVELLNASLQSTDLKQSVQRLTLLESPLDELSKQQNAIIVKGQTLAITIPQLMRPEAGIDKTNLVKVADDGTISLPMVEGLPAAGLTLEQLEKRIADKYRERDLIPNATVTVRAVKSTSTQPPAAEAAPATQPTEESRKMKTPQPPQPMAPSTPSTQPAADSSLTDVVVVIQASRFPVPTPAPAAIPPAK